MTKIIENESREKRGRINHKGIGLYDKQNKVMNPSSHNNPCVRTKTTMTGGLNSLK